MGNAIGEIRYLEGTAYRALLVHEVFWTGVITPTPAMCHRYLLTKCGKKRVCNAYYVSFVC
jgi:hypothetical protein